MAITVNVAPQNRPVLAWRVQHSLAELGLTHQEYSIAAERMLHIAKVVTASACPGGGSHPHVARPEGRGFRRGIRIERPVGMTAESSPGEFS